MTESGSSSSSRHVGSCQHLQSKGIVELVTTCSVSHALMSSWACVATYVLVSRLNIYECNT